MPRNWKQLCHVMSSSSSAPSPIEQAQAAIEYCCTQGWSDGLPLVPASQPLVEKFLATTSRSPDEVIGELEQVGRNCTVYLAAVNAAMAGCLPEYFPVVLAAFDAVMRERAARGGGWQSTSGPAPMIVVNGPVRHELGFNAAGGAFGPGFRPNATVARAIGLIVRNAFGIRPHRRRPAPGREERAARHRPLRRRRHQPGRHLQPHPAVAAARPDRGGGRAQRGHLDGGPDLR